MNGESLEWSWTTERLRIHQPPTDGAAPPRFGRGATTRLAIERRDPLDTVGDVRVRIETDEPTAELWVSLGTAFHGRGYATEALAALVEHLVGELGFVRVIAVIHQEHERGQRLFGRLGFDPVAIDGDEVIWSRRGDRPD